MKKSILIIAVLALLSSCRKGGGPSTDSPDEPIEKPIEVRFSSGISVSVNPEEESRAPITETFLPPGKEYLKQEATDVSISDSNFISMPSGGYVGKADRFRYDKPTLQDGYGDYFRSEPSKYCVNQSSHVMNTNQNCRGTA